jgi:uncharacterized protein (TIGR02118 family)
MVKMLYCMRRLPGMSEEEFNAYWREKHTPLAAKLAPALNLRKYVQTHNLDIPFNEILRRSRGLGEPYDGAGELWWGSVDEMIDALSSDEGMDANAAFIEDEANFIEFSSSCAWICEDHVIYEQGS